MVEDVGDPFARDRCGGEAEENGTISILRVESVEAAVASVVVFVARFVHEDCWGRSFEDDGVAEAGSVVAPLPFRCCGCWNESCENT